MFIGLAVNIISVIIIVIAAIAVIIKLIKAKPPLSVCLLPLCCGGGGWGVCQSKPPLCPAHMLTLTVNIMIINIMIQQA